MFKLICLLTLFSLSVQSSDISDWQITKEEDHYILAKGEAKAELPMTNVNPSVVHVEKYGTLTVVHYLASTSGTSVMLEEYYGAIFSKDDKFLGTYPIRYESLSEAHSSDDIDQPKWNVSNEELNIVYKELKINKRFSIK
ncbi:MAG: hypothetical protein K9K67_07940 [Bacteriovoracaceae bacterium]|nr:hypothetical protein [Bacteriovoracaceae bacterium]